MVVARFAGGYDFIAPVMAEGGLQHPTTPGVFAGMPRNGVALSHGVQCGRGRAVPAWNIWPRSMGDQR